MKPSQISSRLKHIANVIDKTKNPSKLRVASRIKKVLIAMDPNAIQKMTPSQIFSQVFMQEPFDRSLNFDEMEMRLREFAGEHGVSQEIAELAVEFAHDTFMPGGIMYDSDMQK